MPVGQTKIGIHHGIGVNQAGNYSSYETSSTGQALMASHDAFQQDGKEAIHEKLIQDDTVSEHNLSVATKLLATKLMAPVINPQRNPTYAILENGCTMIQRFAQALEPETKFTFANGETAKVNWTLHLEYHTTTQCQHRHP